MTELDKTDYMTILSHATTLRYVATVVTNEAKLRKAKREAAKKNLVSTNIEGSPELSLQQTEVDPSAVNFV